MGLSDSQGQRRVPNELKRRLQEEGRWEEFQRVREELKANGLSPQAARQEAIFRFSQGASESENVSGGGDVVGGSEAGGVAGTPLASASLEDFGGRTASEAEIVRWVARHMEVEDVSPSDAPDPTAWGMLVFYRAKPANKADFWRTIYPKLLPTRSQVENAKADDFDGKSQVDVIEQIQEIRNRVTNLEGVEG